MFQVVNSALKFYVATTSQFIKAQPFQTLALITGSLVSQVALLVAFLLPIKIVLMLGSSRVPRYFPDFMRALPKQDLVIYSCLTALAAFVVYFFAQKMVDSGVKRVARALLENNNKITPLSNHAQLSSKIYRAYVDSLSSFVFITLAFCLVNYLYANLSLVVASYIVLALILSIVSAHLNYRISGYLDKKLGQYLWSMGTLGFLVSFGFIVVDFLVPIDPPQFFFALIGLLFSRQLVSRFGTLVQNVRSLYLRRSKSAAMFFDGYVDDARKPRNESTIWELLQSNRLPIWASGALHDSIGGEFALVNTLWVNTFKPGVFSCLVELAGDEHEESPLYLLKLFTKEKTALAEKEHFFLAENPAFAGDAGFIKSVSVGELRCHVYKWAREVDLVRPTRVMKLDLELDCVRYDIPGKFRALYTNTHALLGERLSVKMVERLSIFASEEQRLMLENVKGNFELLVRSINELPLQLIFSGVSVVAARTDGGIFPVNHDSWRLEPLGFGWPVGDSEDEVREFLLKASSCRSDIDASYLDSVFLCKKMAEFEKKYRAQNFDSAIDCISLVSDRLKMLKGNQEVEAVG